MHLIKPSERCQKLKWNIRFRNHDGRIRTVPGDRDKAATQRLALKVDALVKAKQAGEPPPAVLMPWIENMPSSLAARLVTLGLIQPRHINRNKLLVDWVAPWERVLQERRPESRHHASQQASKVRRIIKACNVTALEELDLDDVTEKINGFVTLGCNEPTPLAPSTRHGHGVAIKDFAKWVARKLKSTNPLADMKLPGNCSTPEYERQPLTVAQFQQLMQYLDTFERYRNQKSRWTAKDRKLIYWTAVRTAYREGELRKHSLLPAGRAPRVECMKNALTLRQAARRLHIHHTTLRRWVQDGEGPRTFVKPGLRRSTYRITAQSLEEFIRRNSVGGK